MERFIGRHILVTGGASGIGAGIAGRLAAEGAQVTVLDIDPLGPSLRGIRSVQGSVADEGAVRDAVRQAADPDGRLHGLVNNAGIMVGQPVEGLSFDEWHVMLDVNVGGYMLAAKHAFGPMRAAGGGAIVNCASIMAYNSGPGQAAYSASKAAVLGLTRGVALDGAPHGIRCNAVCPGTIETPMYERYLVAQDDPDAEHQRTVGMYPLGRLGTPADVAALVAFLLSDDATWITGQDFIIDGGFLAQGTAK
jgi:meso-butanediol dehydrogenase/(S,S)-butanediol dehydrogenase/diacetyl reductase